MALPALRAMASIFPGGMQMLLGEGLLGFVNRSLPITTVGRAWWSDFEQLSFDVARITTAAQPCDLFVALSPWATPSVLQLARTLGAKRTVGFSDMFDVCVQDDSSHMFDMLFSIPKTMCPELQLEDFSFPPSFSPAAEAAAVRFIRQHIPLGQRILFLHPETHTRKMWSAPAFAWVLDRFLEARPDFVALVASVRCYPLFLSRHPKRILCIDEHLELVLAILKHADAFLGIDSCFLHAADLFRIPGIGLFGPTDPSRWGFRLTPESRPIYGNGTMEPIRREAVLEALMQLVPEQKD